MIPLVDGLAGNVEDPASPLSTDEERGSSRRSRMLRAGEWEESPAGGIDRAGGTGKEDGAVAGC